MKIFIFLTLAFSSFVTAACDDDNAVQNVGSPAVDGQDSVQINLGLSASFSGNAVTDCVELPPIKATGFAYFSILRLVIGISYALNALGGGSGGDGGDSEFGELNEDAGCDNLSADQRFDAATAAFNAAMLSATRPGGAGRVAFCRKYPVESTFEFKFPSGETAQYRVFLCTPSFRPLSIEIPDSCG